MSSCAICKKHFKNSQMFLEHLQSQEHRQKVGKEILLFFLLHMNKCFPRGKDVSLFRKFWHTWERFWPPQRKITSVPVKKSFFCQMQYNTFIFTTIYIHNYIETNRVCIHRWGKILTSVFSFLAPGKRLWGLRQTCFIGHRRFFNRNRGGDWGGERIE